MQRRKFINAGAASLVAGIAGTAGSAVTDGQGPAIVEPELPPQDDLNPPRIKVAGIRMVPVVGGKYKVWTKRLGSGAIKVLVLHGGPGFSHEYLEALESFLPQAGIEMYYYDQLGCNNSDQPDDPSLWTLARYVEEVEEVRRGLGLNQFVLFGHSWGGILALEYALKYQDHLGGLVISNMAASIAAFLTRVAWWKEQLPPAAEARINELEATESYEDGEYDKIMMEAVYPRMLCRTRPWPEPLTRALRHVNEKIYVQMQGHSEFLVTGNLKGWDRWDRLREIKVKALTIGSKFDEMDPNDMQRMAALMPNAQYGYCPNGSHLCFFDDQEIYFRHLLGFLKSLKT
jgi:proline iminopeptidase